MRHDRRTLLRLGAGLAGACLPGAAAAAPRAAVPPVSAFGIDAAEFGVRAGSPDDQSAAVQRAIDQTANSGTPLAFAPGIYRVGALRLPSGAHLVAPRGASKLIMSSGRSVLFAENADRITVSGLVIDGLKRPLADQEGLLRFHNARQIKISDCEITGSGRNGIHLDTVAGEVVDNAITEPADIAIFSFDARGLLIARNHVVRAGNNGIQLFCRSLSEDGSLVIDNRIETVTNRSGGDGPFGNGISVFRGANVIVRGNHISHCTFSGVRGNSASNISILGNTIIEAGETAIYSEFNFQGAIIADNIVSGAQTGISSTNFLDHGGRLSVIQGNILRNLARRDSNPYPEMNGIGIAAEADAAVTGNVVERASAAGILVGWGRSLRDVAVTGNVVRDCGFGIGVSVVDGARSALVASNVISGSLRGAVVGLDHHLIVTGDLTREGAAKFPHLTIGANRVS